MPTTVLLRCVTRYWYDRMQTCFHSIGTRPSLATWWQRCLSWCSPISLPHWSSTLPYHHTSKHQFLHSKAQSFPLHCHKYSLPGWPTCAQVLERWPQQRFILFSWLLYISFWLKWCRLGWLPRYPSLCQWLFFLFGELSHKLEIHETGHCGSFLFWSRISCSCICLMWTSGAQLPSMRFECALFCSYNSFLRQQERSPHRC